MSCFVQQKGKKQNNDFSLQFLTRVSNIREVKAIILAWKTINQDCCQLCQFGSLSAAWKQRSVAWLSQPLAPGQGYLLMWQLWEHIHPNPPRLVYIQGTGCTLNVDVSYTCCSMANKPPGKQKDITKIQIGYCQDRSMMTWLCDCKTDEKRHMHTMLYWHRGLMWLFLAIRDLIPDKLFIYTHIFK